MRTIIRDNYTPKPGDYHERIVRDEVNNKQWIFDCDGVITDITDTGGEVVNELGPSTSAATSQALVTRELEKKQDTLTEEQLAVLNSGIDEEKVAQIATNTANITAETSAREAADTTLQNNIDALDNSISTVGKSNDYNDLDNKPTIGAGVITFTENNIVKGTFSANATTNKTIEFPVPTQTSELVNNGADGTSTYVEADELPVVDTSYDSSSSNAIANSTVTNSLDRQVMTNLAVSSNPSTTVVNLDSTKTNLANPSSSVTSSISLPVASTTQAGVMNSAMYDALTKNTQDIANIIGEVVAISNLPANPTQAQLTTAWLNASGEPALINGAGIYDVTNEKRWTYYSNDTTWYALDATGSVTVNPWTNSAAGIVKGSTNVGQIFAENDGTGSVNGWDALSTAVDNNTSKLATIAQGAEVNVQSDWTQTNTSADDYIKNKPTNLVQDAAYVHTDNNFTTTLKNKLDGIAAGAEVNVQPDWDQTTTTADDYIKNKPTIPTVNNATLTIQSNGTTVNTFTANASSNVTANIPSATTSRYGVTELSSSTSSTSTTLAATPSAVKAAYDLATSKAKITMTTTDPGEGATLAANEFIAVY